MSSVKIVEVGLRDGLQNEKQVISVESRIEIGKKLFAAGMKHLEVAAFVREDKIPQMKGSGQVVDGLRAHSSKLRLAALVPNERGMQDALKHSLNEVAVFTAASNSFCKANINCSIDESFERFVPVMSLAKKNKMKVRGYLSTAFGCPYEGKVSEVQVMKLIDRLLEMGCYEVSIGDTIGVASQTQVRSLFQKIKKSRKLDRVAGHFHDTRGLAVANILAAYDLGVHTFDSSIAGLGGCPYAPGASGNVATEDVVNLFNGMKVSTGLNFDSIVEISREVSALLHRSALSKVSQAGVFRPKGKFL